MLFMRKWFMTMIVLWTIPVVESQGPSNRPTDKPTARNTLPSDQEENILVLLQSGARRLFNKTRAFSNDGSRGDAYPNGLVSYWGGEDETDGSTLNFVRVISGMVVGSIVDMANDTVSHFRIVPGGGPAITVTTNSSDFAEEADPLIESDDNRYLRDVVKYNNDTVHRKMPNEREWMHGTRKLYDDSGRNMDVMVVWTKNAECKAAGKSIGCTTSAFTSSNMKALVNLAVEETNTAYERSGVESELVLVHAYRDDKYVESPSSSGFRNALNQVTSTDDGIMDDVHAKREEYGADIVAMVIDNDSFCGLAWIGPNKSRMFSVTAWKCMTGYYSFGHEIAHNLGCDHDRGTRNECANNSKFSYGYRDPDAKFRSIMAYNCRSSQCDNNAGGGCSRVQMFSQPNNNWYNKPIGTKNEDNVRQINAVRMAVAAYYPHILNCESNLDCNDDDPCTVNICKTDGTCVFNAIEGYTTFEATIIPDDYPTETSWSLTNTCTGEIVASNGLNGLSGTNGKLCLPNEAYEFSINDSWGDGICCGYGDGGYTIFLNGKVVASGGEFKFSESSSFGTCSDTRVASPSNSPTKVMFDSPTLLYSAVPSAHPSIKPTKQLTLSPSEQRTFEPSALLTESPSIGPSLRPTKYISLLPSLHPSLPPTPSPSEQPTQEPSSALTKSPSANPSLRPSEDLITNSEYPTSAPSIVSSQFPTKIPDESTLIPSSFINLSNHPTDTLSLEPTLLTSTSPSAIGSQPPTVLPDSLPTTSLNTTSSNPTHKVYAECSVDSDCSRDNPCSNNTCNEDGKCVLFESGLVPVEVDISLDSYPGETSWNLDNTCIGQTVASSVIHQREGTDGILCVPNEAYTFTITDLWGDGICCEYGEGKYRVSFKGRNYEGGDFGFQDTLSFGSCPRSVDASISHTSNPTETPSTWPSFNPVRLTSASPTTSKSQIPTFFPSQFSTDSPSENVSDPPSHSPTTFSAAKFILEYDYIPDFSTEGEDYRQEHMQLVRSYVKQHKCLSWALLRYPRTSTIRGSQFMFVDLQSAEDFISEDPYMRHALVLEHTLSEVHNLVG